jgi:Crinkler effector protein N-terminal domain
MSQSDIYTVLCIVIGEDVPFSVEIEKSKIVSQLKDLIKEKRTDVFANIGSNLLDLYHVDIPDAPKEDLMASMRAHPLDSRGPLLATTRFTNIFPGTPKDDTIHFIVKPSKLHGWQLNACVNVSLRQDPGEPHNSTQ